MAQSNKENEVVRHEDAGGCDGLENPDVPLRCVFSTMTTLKLGTGTTARKQQNKLLWYVKELCIDQYGIWKINPQFVPVGEETVIDKEKLLSEYTPEVLIHNKRVAPAMRELSKTLAKGDKHREKSELFSAEMEYEKALDVDENNVRAIFGLGLVYLERGDQEKSVAVFEQLVLMEGAFHVIHKHLFNEFGIALRKNGLFEEAVQYYSRAAELTSEDENLYYNLARAHYEKGDWEGTFANIVAALRLDREHEHALALCTHVMALADDVALRERYDKPPVPEAVFQGATTLTDALADGQDLKKVRFDLDEADGGDGD